MKRKTIALLLAALMLTLTACGGRDPVPAGTGPGRMVRRIEVAIHPEDAAFERVYVTQENMNELLALLRGMENDERPETEPDIDGGQILYTATVTFANGEQSIYCLLGHTYLRLGDDPWCVINTDLSRKFIDFIKEHPTDDGTQTTETTAPAETTAPLETTAPTA